MQPVNPSVLLPVILIALGPLPLLLGVIGWIRDKPGRYADRVRTMGVVSGWDHHSLPGRTSMPRVTFRTREYREVTVTAKAAVDYGIYPTGQRVEVFYRPEDPRDARLRFPFLFRPYVWLTFVGALVTTVVALVWLVWIA